MLLFSTFLENIVLIKAFNLFQTIDKMLIITFHSMENASHTVS